MSAPAKPSGRILKNYEIVLLVIAIVLIIIVKIQRPQSPQMQAVNEKSLKIAR